VSASRQGKELVLTFSNPRHNVGLKVMGSLGGVAAESAEAQLLHHADFNACNTFEQPDVIAPRPHPVRVQGSRVEMDLPPMSVATAVVQCSS
jgi:alpha-N-arabinofuranosidase